MRNSDNILQSGDHLETELNEIDIQRISTTGNSSG